MRWRRDGGRDDDENWNGMKEWIEAGMGKEMVEMRVVGVGRLVWMDRMAEGCA